MVWALLPLKDFVNAKQRLSGVLAAHERRALVQAMAEDVIEQLVAAPLERIVLISDDPSASLLAEHYGVEHWPEGALLKTYGVSGGLNAAVGAGAQRAAQLGAQAVLVVHGDLPLLATDEITQILQTAATLPTPAVVLVSDRREQGSNCLLCAPPTVLAFQYGENSFAHHRHSALAAGVAVKTLQLDGAACDIDTPADLLTLLDCQAARHSVRYLHDSGIAGRLRAMALLSDESLAVDDASADSWQGNR